MENKRVRIKIGWAMAGRTGTQLADPVLCGGQLWIPLLWHGYGVEDPDFFKTAGLEEIKLGKNKKLFAEFAQECQYCEIKHTVECCTRENCHCAKEFCPLFKR